MVKTWPSHFIHGTRARIRGAFLVFGVMAAIVSVISVPASQVHAVAPPTAIPGASSVAAIGDAAGAASSYGTNVSSCEIETVGWVICPVMRSIAKLADYGFAFINQNFLKIEYGISNFDSGVYKAWEIMRNVANALFVLAFMAFVYIQMTGRSSGGYNIKRILPRLIIGAILVNISYFVCVIGIEVSNAVGGSILAIMQGISDRIGPAAMTLSSAAQGFKDSRLSDITSAVLTKSGTVWILLAPVAAVTVSIAIICAAGLVLLIMRKVVVAMLVLVSPLMFVTYLLPNTERYFQQWLRLFFQLLLLYPVIAFLLGTGQIISATIINVGSGTDSNYRVRDDGYMARNGGSGSVTTDLAAAGAAVLPLLGTWFLLKSLSSVATNAGTKVAGNIGRRGSKKEEAKIKAQMEGKAKQSINGAGALPSYDRRPAFSRLRRRRGASTLADELSSKASAPGSASGTGKAGGTPSLFDRAIGNVNGAGVSEDGATSDEASKKIEDATNARIAEAEAGQLKADVSGGDDKKNKTAKDIFNNMNQSHQMDKKSSGGGGNDSSGDSTAQPGSAGPTAQPKAPGNNFTAPIASGGAAAGPQTPKIIAIPVEVDASTFLKKTEPTGVSSEMLHTPTTEVAKKAKERANKYLFNAQDELNKSSDKLDELKEIRLQQKKAEEENKDSKDGQ